MNILTKFRLSEKNLQLEPLEKKYFNLIEELSPKIMSSSFLRSTFGLTQTTKSCNGRMKYRKFLSLDSFRSTPEKMYSYSKLNFF